MNGVDDQSLRIQLVMLLGSLPVLVVMGITGLWALLRLHDRPRAGWIVLGVTALSVFQLGGTSALWMLFGSFGGQTIGEYLSLAVLVVNNIAEVAIWWLLLLGLFGPHPFRGNSSPEDEPYQQ